MSSDLVKKAVLDMKETILRDLQLELDEEMSKSSRKRDYQKIAELTKAIQDVECEGNSDFDYEETRNVILERLESQKKSKRSWRKAITVAVTCCVVLIGINFATFSTLGLNMFQAIHQLAKGGMTVDLTRNEEIILSTTEDDPYGIKAKCAEYNIYPETPSYIPDDFYLGQIDYTENDIFKKADFVYKKDSIKLIFSFTQFNSGDYIPPIGVPTDTYEFTEETINDQTMYILKEDGQFTAIFLKEDIQYSIFAEYLDYDTCYKIVKLLSK